MVGDSEPELDSGFEAVGIDGDSRLVYRYVLARWSFRGANAVFAVILFGMFIPYTAVMIPLNQLVLDVGIPTGVPTLLMLHVVYGIPITPPIFRYYYQTVPHDLLEAGRVHGAGMLRPY